jgi:hypothetical protein
MDVAAPPVMEATVADAVRTSVVTRNYYQNNLGRRWEIVLRMVRIRQAFAIPLLELARSGGAFRCLRAVVIARAAHGEIRKVART